MEGLHAWCSWGKRVCGGHRNRRQIEVIVALALAIIRTLERFVLRQGVTSTVRCTAFVSLGGECMSCPSQRTMIRDAVSEHQHGGHSSRDEGVTAYCMIAFVSDVAFGVSPGMQRKRVQMGAGMGVGVDVCSDER